MSSKRENLTTRSSEVVFSSAISSNTTTIGQIIDLQSIYKTAMAGVDGNTANAVAAKSAKVKAIEFEIFVTSYTDGAYVPVLEGVSVSNVPVPAGQQYNVSMTSAQAATLFSAVTNPYTNTIYNVSNDKIVSYDYPTILPVSGSYVDLNAAGNPQLPIIGAAISRSDATVATSPKLNFRFAYIPGFGAMGSNYSFLRFSMNSSSVTTGATFFVVATKTYEAMF